MFLLNSEIASMCSPLVVVTVQIIDLLFIITPYQYMRPILVHLQIESREQERTMYTCSLKTLRRRRSKVSTTLDKTILSSTLLDLHWKERVGEELKCLPMSTMMCLSSLRPRLSSYFILGLERRDSSTLTIC